MKSIILAFLMSAASVLAQTHAGHASIGGGLDDVGHPHSNETINVVAFPSTEEALNISDSIRGEPDLDTEVGSEVEPSGLYWHRGMQRLVIVDDEGYMALMTQHGDEKEAFNLKPAMLGNRDDLEAVTAVDMDDTNYLWVVWERGAADACILSKINFRDAAGTDHKHYSLENLAGPFADSNWKVEAMTYIPDEDLPHWLEEDYTYTSTNGLFLVARQEDGQCFFIDVDPYAGATGTNINSLATNKMVYSFYPRLTADGSTRSDISDLHWDREFKTLYLIVDDDGSDVNDPPRSSVGPRTLYGYSIEQDRVWAEWWLPGWTNVLTGIDNPEGFAIGEERETFFVGNDDDDVAGLNYVLRYDLQVRGEEELRARNVTMWRDPDADDDELLKYAIGSRWDNVADGNVWICTDATAGAAVWADLASGADNLGNHTITNHLLPNASNTWDIGSAAMPIRDMYLSSNSLYMGAQRLGVAEDGALTYNGTPIVGTNGVVPLARLSGVTTNQMDEATRLQIHAGGGSGLVWSTNTLDGEDTISVPVGTNTYHLSLSPYGVLGNSDLADLADVAPLTGATANDVLRYNGTLWTNASAIPVTDRFNVYGWPGVSLNNNYATMTYDTARHNEGSVFDLAGDYLQFSSTGYVHIAINIMALSLADAKYVDGYLRLNLGVLTGVNLISMSSKAASYGSVTIVVNVYNTSATNRWTAYAGTDNTVSTPMYSTMSGFRWKNAGE